MYENTRHPPLSRIRFLSRMLFHGMLASALLVVSLGGGMWGYVRFEGLSWLDAFLNSAMLLGGMGPVNPPATASGKLFAGLYALYAGLFFIVTAALIATPVLHRLLHRLHWDEEETK